MVTRFVATQVAVLENAPLSPPAEPKFTVGLDIAAVADGVESLLRIT